MAAEIHVNDIGTAIVATIKDENDEIVDVSTATEKTMYFKKPDKTLLTKEATLKTDGTDGVIQYVFASGELDMAGVWLNQAKVVFVDGQWHSSIDSFQVSHNLEDCS